MFPGGLGTINELFEAWVGASDHKIPCPIVIIPSSFYKPFLDAIEKVAVDERCTIDRSVFNMVEHAHNSQEAVQLLEQPMRQKRPGGQLTLCEKLIYLRHELGRGLTIIFNLPPSIVIIGPRFSLTRIDPEVQFIGRLVKEIAKNTTLGIRLGADGVMNEVVTESLNGSDGHQNIRIQRVFMTEDTVSLDEVDAHFESRSAHCETLIANAKCAVFLPGDIPTLNTLFALVCEIQTGRRPSMPVYLIGDSFWQPILEVSVILLLYDIHWCAF